MHLMTLITIASTAAAAASIADAGVVENTETTNEPVTVEVTEEESMGGGGGLDTGGKASAEMASFPWYWIGCCPPSPPYGTYWVFLGYDAYGRAHWERFCY